MARIGSKTKIASTLIHFYSFPFYSVIVRPQCWHVQCLPGLPHPAAMGQGHQVGSHCAGFCPGWASPPLCDLDAKWLLNIKYSHDKTCLGTWACLVPMLKSQQTITLIDKRLFLKQSKWLKKKTGKREPRNHSLLHCRACYPGPWETCRRNEEARQESAIRRVKREFCNLPCMDTREETVQHQKG